MEPAALRILVVEPDSSGHAADIRALLEGRNDYVTQSASDQVDSAIAACKTFAPDCVLLADLELAKRLCEKVDRRRFATVLRAPLPDRATAHAQSEWVDDYLPTDNVTLDLVDRVLRNAAEKFALRRDLAQVENELAESRSHLQLAQEVGCLGTWIWNPKSKELASSSLFSALYGRTGGAAWDDIWNRWPHADDRVRLATELESALTGQPFDTEFRALWPDRTTHWLRARGKLLEHPVHGERFHGSIVDVTEVRAGAQQLKRSNNDLERFAYVASHDLQEPLRNVMSFSELFARRNKDIDAESKQYLGYVRQGGNRMQTLVTDLLTFSRIMQARLEELEPLDCNEVMAEVLEAMREPVTDSGVKIVTAQLPQLKGSFQLMMQLFENLIGNAIKFRRADNPTVEVFAARSDHAWQFTIADNGIGFEMDYAERIFEAFRRLHARDQFPGTGLGLAICQRIVERHGGRIWAESKPGSGSTFFFTIGDNAAAAAIA